MTNCSSRSDERVDYASTRWVESTTQPGVRYQLARLSLGRRITLTRSVRSLWQRMEYHGAGGTVEDSLSQAVLAAELDVDYLRWGLLAVEGLVIDGGPANVQQLIEAGPEPLCREIVAAIRTELGLTEDERKN